MNDAQANILTFQARKLEHDAADHGEKAAGLEKQAREQRERQSKLLAEAGTLREGLDQ